MVAFGDFEWNDITPIDIAETTAPLCHILYTEEFKKVMGYAKALMARKEYSERAYFITDEVINIASAHYTVWKYRFDIVVHLKKNLVKELDWCDNIAYENEKNYQIWPYRQQIIELLEKETESIDDLLKLEYPLLDIMIEQDSKNYHVWSHRRWLVEKFNLYRTQRELEFTNDKINLDVRNNSAWNHRFLVQFGDIVSNSRYDEKYLRDEIILTKDKIDLCPENSSSWNYLQAVYKKFSEILSIDELNSFTIQYTHLVENPRVISTQALELTAEIYQKSDKNKSEEIYELLSTTYDPIRKNYWGFCKNLLYQA
ncbi:BA75_01666T0 [Komagataella pastoris]|uniref:Protein farnesyltransferase/geranylgeranyltransferase type-1 subunit alpha n=1 Tax=Komagataella pastoris TaxID=4922 RepID=A0A1B2J817_PICPA|nr:BA75_01666T0 [Komagataella pastoris]